MLSNGLIENKFDDFNVSRGGIGGKALGMVVSVWIGCCQLEGGFMVYSPLFYYGNGRAGIAATTAFYITIARRCWNKSPIQKIIVRYWGSLPLSF